jgi:crotonobetaine/carnitine-CoA ligase
MEKTSAIRDLSEYYGRIRQIEQEPLPPNILALLEAAAAEVPDQTALYFISDDLELTYRALLENVNRLANGLVALGISSGSHVALMMPNVAEWPITWLALAKIGAVCVPINTRYTARELKFAIDDAEIGHFVIAEAYLPTLESIPGAMKELCVIVVGRPVTGHHVWDELLAGGADHFQPQKAPALDDLMNIQYTSGTTGLPKGCLLTHRYWLKCARSHGGVAGSDCTRLLANNPFFYMTPQWLTLMALMARGTLFVATHLSGSHTMEWVRRYGIHFFLMNRIIFDQPPSDLDRQHQLKKVWVYGFPKRLHAELEMRFGIPAREAFGMTEIGAGLFTPMEADFMTGSGSAGLAGPFRECRVVDMDGIDVPVDVAGELLFRGPGILKGYYRRPDANLDGFHGEWFRTGDLVTRDADGFIYVVGRIKDMVRRAGESVAAREVEDVLNAMPGIAEAAVVPVPDPVRGEEVKAYLRLAQGFDAATVPVDAVLAHCADNLAVFKVPRYLEYREGDFPRTPSGKIRKPALVSEKPDLRAGSWDSLEGKVH